MSILVGCLEYEVNDSGLLLKRRGKGLLKWYSDKDGYLKYVITTPDGKLNRRVHRIVWEVFNGPIPDGFTVDHVDMDKENNSIENLRLLSPEDNARDGNAKCWKIIDPEGTVNLIWNMEAFCRNEGLHAGHMREVCNGKLNQYKGWKL